MGGSCHRKNYDIIVVLTVDAQTESKFRRSIVIYLVIYAIAMNFIIYYLYPELRYKGLDTSVNIVSPKSIFNGGMRGIF